MKPETDLDKALYQCDLMQDEFVRISHLTTNTEIRGLCERAQIRLKSEISFFTRLEMLENKARKYDSITAKAELGDAVIGSHIAQLIDKHKSTYAAAKAFNVKATQLHRLADAGAMVDASGQVWIKSNTKLEVNCHDKK